LFLHAPEAEIVFLVVVEVIDMDDLDVIRLAVADNITRERIARAGMKVKGKVWKGVVEVSRVAYLTFPQIFPNTLPQEPAEIGVSKRRLEQVRPDSAFWSSEMSRGVTRKPCASMRARVRGKDAGKMIVPPSARALAAWGSAGSTSIHSYSARGAVSNQARFARSVLQPRQVTADFR